MQEKLGAGEIKVDQASPLDLFSVRTRRENKLKEFTSLRLGLRAGGWGRLIQEGCVEFLRCIRDMIWNES